MDRLVNYHSVVLFVSDIRRAKAFYVDLLGFEVEHDFGTNIIFKGGLSIWQINPEHIINQKYDISNLKACRFELYFETKLMDDFLEKINTFKYSKLHDIIEEPWGQKTVRFFDPDGHMIEVGESLETFVYRLYKSGMTVEQVAQRTSVAVGAVGKIVADASGK